jgi:hypothetical protein
MAHIPSCMPVCYGGLIGKLRKSSTIPGPKSAPFANPGITTVFPQETVSTPV